MPVPQRGEVWLVDLGLVAKVRPCLVVSVPVLDEDRALVTLLAHTTSPRRSRFEVASQVPYLRQGVFDAQNIVTVPLAKAFRRLGALPKDQLLKVEHALCQWLGLEQTGEVR